MSRSWTRLIAIFSLVSVLACWAASPVRSEEKYILPELLDVNQIRTDEQLSGAAAVVRVYIFLAVWTDGEYKTYTANGQGDKDGDGNTTMQEPNDLEEYTSDTPSITSKLEIKDDTYTSYISNLPNFKELFPDQTDPFDDNVMIGVDIASTAQDADRLVGSETVPIVSENGDSTGIDRFIAFCNKGEITVKVDKKDTKETIVKSFGFIEVKMMD